MQRSEWDFVLGWQGLLDNHKWFLLEYEYARSSGVARDGIARMRVGGSRPLGPAAYVLLSKFKEFPDTPFLSIRLKERERLVPARFGELELAGQKFPKEAFYQGHRKKLDEVPLEELESDIRRIIRANADTTRVQKHYLLPINWRKYSNKELSEAFQQWLLDNRPEEIPDPLRQGRNPIGVRYRNIKDRLNMLAAYRFDRAGITREGAKALGFEEYTSDQGWKKAYEGAADLLQSMFPNKG